MKTGGARQSIPLQNMKKGRNLIQVCLLGAALLSAPASEAQLTVAKIAAGGGHSLLLMSDGSLWAMGYNGFGQLGDGTFNNRAVPEEIVSNGVTAIAAGYGHSLFVKSDGSLWVMGWNVQGQLGDGTFNNANVPEMIVASNVTAVAGGNVHSLFLKSDGSLWAMGDNGNGELGDGTTDDGNYYTNLPEEIVTRDVTAIAAGGQESIFIKKPTKTQTELFVMGSNGAGELGDGTLDPTNVPVEITSFISGERGSPVTTIAVGYGHALFLKGDGSLWAMGDDYYGQLGDGANNNNNRPEEILSSGVRAISAGFQHSLFIKSDGSLWAMGGNSNGELGDGTFNNANVPVEIESGGVTAVAAGGGFFYGTGGHSLFIESDGSLWAMGDNFFGELGDGNDTIEDSNLDPAGVVSPELIQILQPPALGSITYSNQPVVFFPASGTNYALKMSTNPASGNWVTITNGISFLGVQITNGPGAAFFKLQ